MGRVFRAALACAVLLTAAPVAARADWPLYGHDLSNSRDAGRAGPPASQASSLKPAWSFKASSGDFTGTPVVAGGVVVAGDSAGTVYALDAITGKLRWSRTVGPQINGSAAIDLAAPGGAEVFVPVANPGSPALAGLSLATGAVRWMTTLTKQPGADVFGSPVFHDGTVYIGTSGPNSDNATARGSLVALDEGTGQVRWRTFTVPPGHDGGAIWSTPAIDPATGLIYAGTGNAYHAPAAATTDSIVVFDSAGGALLRHFQAVSGDTFTLPANPLGPDADFGSSPNLLAGGLVGDGAKNGVYYAVKRGSLSPVWSSQIGPGAATGGILASSAYDGRRVYGTDTIDGQVWALGAGGARSWASVDPSTLDYSPPTVANGVLYTIDPLGLLVARNPATGAVLGGISLGGPDFGGISATGRALYVETGTGFGTGAGSVVAFGDTSRSGAGARRATRKRHRRRVHETRPHRSH